MTKKHFQALADELKGCRPLTGNTLQEKLIGEAWVEACEKIANVCQESNPRFDRARFLKACGMEEGS